MKIETLIKILSSLDKDIVVYIKDLDPEIPPTPIREISIDVDHTPTVTLRM